MIIISGGQTGADQGGLLGARDAGFSTGGFAPKNFLTEDGGRKELLTDFGLVDSGLDYVGRTRLNASESDITIWFGKTGSPGFIATRREARSAGKIFTVVTDWSPEQISELIRPYNIVNVAGNRESLNPGIGLITREKMRKALELIKADRP
jgi:hypothetical protein